MYWVRTKLVARFAFRRSGPGVYELVGHEVRVLRAIPWLRGSPGFPAPSPLPSPAGGSSTGQTCCNRCAPPRPTPLPSPAAQPDQVSAMWACAGVRRGMKRCNHNSQL